MGFYIRPTWPFTRRELDSWHGLAVTVEHDVVRLWLVWPGEYWQSASLNREDEVSMRDAFWEAKCLLFEYKTGQGLSQRSYLLSSPSHIQHHGIASSPDTLSSREFEARCNSGELTRYWGHPYRADDYGNRHSARLCRLVCRDWAKQIPLGDPDLRVSDDVVWHCVEDVWRVLPKRHWAWEFREIEWWMERRHQYSIRTDWKAWYPKLIRPIDDADPSKSQETSTLSSLAITSKQYRSHLELSSFGRPFLGHVRDMDERELYRTCRLVCRNWARQFPATDPERGKLWLREGVMWYLMDGDWRVLPSGYWAWVFQDVEWWAERFCAKLSGCTKTGCRCKGWYPKLLQPVDDTIRQNAGYPTPMKRPPKCKPRALNTASSLPPELFKYICKAADSESWSCRLVCRYWNRQCTPHVFKRIDIYRSPERIRALWKVRAHPMLKQYVEIIDGVPVYDKHPKFPWIHLLTQICTCTQAVWRCEGMKALILLTNVPKRIRSIHFALPRSVPRSFSSGIRILFLLHVKVRQIEDLTHLACELPDLEKLWCNYLTFDSLPAELPRRRPRKSRNKLKGVCLAWTKVAGVESTPLLMIPVLSLFLSVYDAASFFSDEEAAVILATLSRANSYSKRYLACSYDEQTRQLEFHLLDEESHSWAYFRFKVSSAHNTITLRVGIDAGHDYKNNADYLDRWKNLDIMFGRLRSESLEVCTQVVFGFHEREDMVHFAENVLGQLPSISEHFTVQYSIWWRNEKRDWHWYQASLDSEDLRGEPKKELLAVYP